MASAHPIENTSVPAPATNIATITATSCGSAPSMTIGTPSVAMPSMPSSSGLSSRTRSITTVISTSPTDSADSVETPALLADLCAWPPPGRG